MIFLKQSTASQTIHTPQFVDSTDFVSPETGLTIANTDILISKAGASYAAKNSGGATHDSDGFYTFTLDATDTNTVGTLQYQITVAGALSVWGSAYVLEEAIYDALFASSAAGFDSSAQVVVASTATGAITADSLAADCITAAKIADDAISTEHLADDVAIGALYAGGIWYSSGGSAGTTIGTNGLPGNPCSSISDAITMASSTGLNRIYCLSNATLASAPGSIEIVGVRQGVIVGFGSQDCSGTIFRNVSFSGTMGASSDFQAFNCIISGTGLVSSNGIYDSLIVGPTTLAAASPQTFKGCSTRNTYGSPATFNMTNGSIGLIMEDVTGGYKFTNMDATSTVTMSGVGNIVIDSTCSGGTISIRGNWSVDDQSSGAVTVVYLGVEDAFTVTDSGFAPTTTQFKITQSPFADDIPIGRTVAWTDGTTLEGHKTICLDWDSSLQVVTVEEMPSAPVSGDTGKWE